MGEADMARADAGGAAHARAAEHPLGAKRGLELLDVADAVLEGDGEAVRRQDSRAVAAAAGGIVGVDEHDRQIGACADRVGRCRRGARDDRRAPPSTRSPSRLIASTCACQASIRLHLVPGQGEQPAVAAAHRAGADHRDLHVPSSPRAAADLSPGAGPGKRMARPERFVLAMSGDILQEWRASQGGP